MAAKRQDFEVEGDLLQARDAGHAIVDEAVERQADAIIIGVPFRRPFGEFELGRVPATCSRRRPARSSCCGCRWTKHVRNDHGLRPPGRRAGDDARERRPRDRHPGRRQVRLRPPAARLQGPQDPRRRHRPGHAAPRRRRARRRLRRRHARRQPQRPGGADRAARLPDRAASAA